MIRDNVWGTELILDAGGCDKDLINDSVNIRAFTIRLVKDIDMVAFGDPQVVYFGSGDKAGYTMQQLIETSNICAHFVPDMDALFLNVHSCKDFDPQVVYNLVKQYFGAKVINYQKIDRSVPEVRY